MLRHQYLTKDEVGTLAGRGGKCRRKCLDKFKYTCLSGMASIGPCIARAKPSCLLHNSISRTESAALRTNICQSACRSGSLLRILLGWFGALGSGLQPQGLQGRKDGLQVRRRAAGAAPFADRSRGRGRRMLQHKLWLQLPLLLVELVQVCLRRG